MRENIETAAVVLRTAPSFIRFGHFEHFAAAGNAAAVQQLVDFVCKHHYPHAATLATPEARAVAMLDETCQRTAQLMAQWQAVGFCHGVMNTDNMSILGLTLDYGPFGFLDTFDAHHICNHTDQQGALRLLQTTPSGALELWVVWRKHCLSLSQTTMR